MTKEKNRELVIFIFCGSILNVAAFLVFKEHLFQFLSYSLQHIEGFKHPYDYVAHFVTCFAGVIFFFIFFKKFNYEPQKAIWIGIILMISASFFKELVLDPELSKMDVFCNFLGMILAYENLPTTHLKKYRLIK